MRFLGTHFKPYQQVTARAFVGFILGLLFYKNRLRFKVIKATPKKDILLLILRSFILVIGIGLFTASIMKAKFANINFIYSLPTMALLGLIFLKEKLTLKKLILLITAFVGAALVATNNISSILSWGFGETLALISTFFYSLAYIIRKWLSDTLRNEEIAEMGAFFSFIFALLFSQILANGVLEFITLSPFLLFITVMAGATFITLGYLGNYGFQKIEAIIANNILVLESIFGLLIGFFVYRETPILRELIGGLIIAISAVCMNKLQFADE